MRKLAMLLSLGVVGLPSFAMAQDVVTLAGRIVANERQTVAFIQASSPAITLPPSCKVLSNNTATCLSDLLKSGWKLVNSFGIDASEEAYFVLSK